MSARVKSSRCVGLPTLQPSYADCLEFWEPRLPGTFRDRPDLYRNCFTKFTFEYFRSCLNAERIYWDIGQSLGESFNVECVVFCFQQRCYFVCLFLLTFKLDFGKTKSSFQCASKTPWSGQTRPEKIKVKFTLVQALNLCTGSTAQ